MADNEWLLAVSKEEISRKLADFAGKHPDLKNRFILAETNPKKLKNALSAYAHLEAGEEAVILYDDTLMGGARDGFIVTNKNVYIHNSLSETKKLPISNIRAFGVKGMDIIIDLKKVSTAMADDKSRKDMVSLLKAVVPVAYAAKDSEKSETAKAKKDIPQKTQGDKPKADGSEFLTIKDGVVTGCDKTATKVTIPLGVKEIGEVAFQCCTALKSISIPKTVTKIGKCAFFDCSSLKSVSISNGVTEIGENAFDSCEALEKITYSGTADEWEDIAIGEDAFSGILAEAVHCSDGDVALDSSDDEDDEAEDEYEEESEESETDEDSEEYESDDEADSDEEEDDEDSDDEDSDEYDPSKYFKSETFQGFLYDDYGVGADIKNLDTAVQILKEKSIFIGKNIEDQEEIYNGLYLVPVLFRFPESCGFLIGKHGIGLLTDYENESCVGNFVYFPYSDASELEKLLDMLGYVVDKYGYKEDKKNKKYLDAAGMQLYALPSKDIWGSYINYEDDRNTRYIGISCSDDAVAVFSLFGQSARDAWISLAKSAWWVSFCINTEEHQPDIYYSDEDTFNKLLDKWADIFSRDDAKEKINVTNGPYPNVTFKYTAGNGAVLLFDLEYKGGSYGKKDVISLKFQKGTNKLECSASIHFGDTFDEEEMECLYSLRSVLTRLGKAEMDENYRKITADDEEMKLEKRRAAIAKHKKELEAKRREQEAREKAEREINGALDDL